MNVRGLTAPDAAPWAASARDRAFSASLPMEAARPLATRTASPVNLSPVYSPVTAAPASALPARELTVSAPCASASSSATQWNCYQALVKHWHIFFGWRSGAG